MCVLDTPRPRRVRNTLPAKLNANLGGKYSSTPVRAAKLSCFLGWRTGLDEYLPLAGKVPERKGFCGRSLRRPGKLPAASSQNAAQEACTYGQMRGEQLQ
jgi:hypothetical protein